MKLTLNDISIIPAAISTVDSRRECCPYNRNNMLPLFTAPMSSVVDLKNYQLFKDNKISSIIPRTVDISDRLRLCTETWCAFSLEEFINLPLQSISNEKYMYISIDIANGHMVKLHNAIRDAKKVYGDKIVIMAGNIANPETYRILSEAGADYVRVGIGTGSVCITASNTGIFYALASLIKECSDISKTLDNPAKIIADGGIKGFADIIKCLALGAQFVMVGSVFNKMLESAGRTYYYEYYPHDKRDIDQYTTLSKVKFESGVAMYKEHYGMSTKRAQIEINGEGVKTSEGIEKMQEVEYTMSQWVENFTDYLKSAMSYTGMFNLQDFIGGVETIILSNNSYNSINK